VAWTERRECGLREVLVPRASGEGESGRVGPSAGARSGGVEPHDEQPGPTGGRVGEATDRVGAVEEEWSARDRIQETR